MKQRESSLRALAKQSRPGRGSPPEIATSPSAPRNNKGQFLFRSAINYRRLAVFVHGDYDWRETHERISARIRIRHHHGHIKIWQLPVKSREEHLYFRNRKA